MPDEDIEHEDHEADVEPAMLTDHEIFEALPGLLELTKHNE